MNALAREDGPNLIRAQVHYRHEATNLGETKFFFLMIRGLTIICLEPWYPSIHLEYS